MKGLALVSEIEVDLLLRETVDDRVGIDARVGGHREHVAVARVERDDGARLLAQRRLGERLDADIDAEAHIAAGNRRARDDLADRPTGGVENCQRTAAAAGQRALEEVLDPIAADHVAGAVALNEALFELFRIDLLEVADDVRGEIAVGIPATRLAAHEDALAGELFVLLDQVVRRADRQLGDRHKLVAGNILVDQRTDDRLFHTEPVDEEIDDQILVAHGVPVDADDRDLGGAGEDLAAAVQNAAARGPLDQRADQVALGRKPVEDQPRRPVDDPVRLAQDRDEDNLLDFAEIGGLIAQDHLKGGRIDVFDGDDLPAEASDRGLGPDIAVALGEALRVVTLLAFRRDRRPGLEQLVGGEQVKEALHGFERALRRDAEVFELLRRRGCDAPVGLRLLGRRLRLCGLLFGLDRLGEVLREVTLRLAAEDAAAQREREDCGDQ